MTGLRRIGVLISACLLLFAAGCGKKTTTGAAVPEEPKVAVSCIAVLPVTTAVDYEGTVSFADAKKLRDGVQIMESRLRQELAGREDIRFVGEGQIYGMKETIPEDFLSRARVIADHLSCNAVLETTIWRYSDRIGGRYTAEEPASVAFEYRLVEVESGTVLCRGKFDEVQKSVMENLYNFKTSRMRGFTWVTAEELLSEGVKEKFDECSYLAQE
ncbi:MAG: hypothetical protein GQ559_12115 [Desulfobulbaceae bacterium]|nr:hypothetical protein [Desulfobulbaceae bacterium]